MINLVYTSSYLIFTTALQQYSISSKNIGSRITLIWSQMPVLLPLQSSLTSLCFHFFMGKMRVTQLRRVVERIKWDHVCDVLSSVPGTQKVFHKCQLFLLYLFFWAGCVTVCPTASNDVSSTEGEWVSQAEFLSSRSTPSEPAASTCSEFRRRKQTCSSKWLRSFYGLSSVNSCSHFLFHQNSYLCSLKRPWIIIVP